MGKAELIGIDTNILLRWLVRDDLGQLKKVLALFQVAGKAGQPIFIAQVVLVEGLWTLERTFKYSREMISAVLHLLLNAKELTVEEEVRVSAALELYAGSHTGFSDCLILAGNQQAGVETTFTFDKKAAKISGYRLL